MHKHDNIKNIEEFKTRGVKRVITFTPNMNGRTFGANVMEAMVASILKKHPKDTTDREYNDILDNSTSNRISLIPRRQNDDERRSRESGYPTVRQDTYPD